MVSQVKEILHFLQLLGFVINQEKSVLSPSQTIQFLGFIVDSALMVISLPQKKVVDMTKACQAALLQGTLSVRDLSRLIGQMSATMRAVLPAPLCYRNLQRIKNQELSRSHSFEAMVTLDDSAKEELLWWVHQLTTWNGRAILSQTPDLVVETDASLLGWGAVPEGMRTGGLWSEKERTQHINCLELMAGALAVRTFAKHKRNPCTITNGQQNGNLLHKPYGGNPIPEYGTASLSAMAVVSPERDNSFSRVFTRGKERDSRRRIMNHAIFSRMANA